MSKVFARVSLLSLAVAAAAGTAWAQAPVSSADRSASEVAGVKVSSSKVSRADAAFLKQAAQNGHAEVEGSKLALSKGTHPQVKAFAQMMVDDHTKAGNALNALAASKGVDVPGDPSLAQKAKLKILSARDGAGFDHHYAESIGVAAHEDTIKLFKKAAAEADDADIKAFATKTLPTLEHHLQSARELEAATAKAKK